MTEALKTAPAATRGNAEVHPELVTPIEVAQSGITSEQVAMQITALKESLQHNEANTQFDPNTWMRKTNVMTDDAVYARVFDRVHTGNATGYENEVLDYMKAQSNANEAQAFVAMDSLGDDNGAAAINELITKHQTQLAAENDEAHANNIRMKIAAMQDTLSRLGQDNSEAYSQDLAVFYGVVESSEANNDKSMLAASQPIIDKAQAKVTAASQEMRNDAITYALLSSVHPSEYLKTVDQQAAVASQNPQETQSVVEQSPEVAAVPESEELIAAKQSLQGLRGQIATLNAKREKRMWGTDSHKGDARHNPKNKELYAQYHAASRKVFELNNPDFLADDTLSHAEKVRQIAEYTATEAGKLDTTELESYRNTDTFFGKMLNKYGNLSTTKKILIGGLGGLAVGALTGGYGTFAWSGALISSSLEAKRREKRRAGENMLNVDATELTNEYLAKPFDLNADGNEAAYDAIFSGAQQQIRSQFEGRIEKEQSKRLRRVAGSLALGATIGVVTHNLPGGLFDGWNGPHDQVTSAIDPSHGTESISNVDPSHVTDIYAGPTDVYVNPGDGFYNVFQNMNIPHDQWSSILDKVGPDLVQHGDAYWMPDGTVGISSPGMMSQHALEMIARARGL